MRAEALQALVNAAGPRVAAVQLTGDVAADAAKLRDTCGGGTEIAFDMVGRASDPNATLAALKSLCRGGRLVLMGSMTTPLPLSYGDVMRNNLEIIGQFMYPAGAYRSLLGLVRAELLDLKPIRVLRFPLAALPAAMDAAAKATNLECVVIEP
jgi:alcohol dehydrogenase